MTDPKAVTTLAVVSPEGCEFHCGGTSRTEATRFFTHYTNHQRNDDTWTSWAEYYRRGYRVRRVTLTPDPESEKNDE